jgi:pyruvate dehydrogenase E2 component (dihydrolipoamide acetyltransferase)
MRRAIATRLAESNREAPVFTIRGSARVDALLALREDLNQATDVRISVNDLIVAAVARAHVTVPEMNVIWMPDAVRRFDDVDIAVAVATDAGLVTPVIRGVQSMTVSSLARFSTDAVGRARSGRLRQDELEGGTLTVTNLGVFGTEDFTAVINPPQAAILAVGAARPEAVVTDGDLGIATVLRVTLSVDHRPVDGATAATWMAAFLALLESPLRILV